MKTVKVGTQGVKGGNYKENAVGYATVINGGDKIISIDNFVGAADSYRQREEPIICIFGETSYDVLFEGTHKQLMELFKKHEKMLNPLGD